MQDTPTAEAASPPPNPSKRDAASRDRTIVAVGVASLAAAGWAWLLWQDWSMRHMDVADMAMPSSGRWDVADLGLVFVMWAIMMVAMMVPSVVPVTLLYRRVAAARDASARPAFATALFVCGYIGVWTAFSAVATLAQWALHAASLISASMQTTSDVVGGIVLIAAGSYQWTPAKLACLRSCRSPFAFVLNHWRPGALSAFAMGVDHGALCTGCCWMMMSVLFAVGVMNLAWIAVLTALVVAEKLAPRGDAIARAAGIALVGWGAWLAVSALIAR